MMFRKKRNQRLILAYRDCCSDCVQYSMNFRLARIRFVKRCESMNKNADALTKMSRPKFLNLKKMAKKLEGTKMGCPFLFPQIFANPLAFTTLEDLLVGATGFEPATSWSQTTRATNCATPRLLSGDRVSTGISASVQDQISGPWKKFRMGWRVLTFMSPGSCVI